MDGKKIDRLCELLEQLLAQRSDSEPEESEDDFEGALNDSEEDGDLAEEYKRGASKQTPKAKNLGGGVVPITEEGAEGNVNPVAAADALKHLRRLRPWIEANGDRAAIDSYNRAVRMVKRQASAESFAPALATDSHSTRRNDAATFEANATKLHRTALDPHEKFYGDERSALDSEKPELTFDQAVARARDEARARFTPKKRV